MAELVEGARLLSECMPKGVPRVRIPLSPPKLCLDPEARKYKEPEPGFGSPVLVNSYCLLLTDWFRLLGSDACVTTPALRVKAQRQVCFF